MEALVAQAKQAIGAVADLDALEALASELTGRKSLIAKANQELKDLPPGERPEAGRRIGQARAAINALFEARRGELMAAGEAERIRAERIDVSLPGPSVRIGHEHVISKTIGDLTEILVGMGYRVAEGNEVDTDYYNFEALNTPPGHPARSMQDTLYVESGRGEEVLLRTQTSGVQVHEMESCSPPLYMIAPGRVFRRDTLDPSHSPVFHQIEGLAVDSDLTLGDLAGTLKFFIREYFGGEREIKLRPSYFPFTEPSVEVSMSCFLCDGSGCRTCGHAGWIEVLGAGMVDPNVFGSVGYDSERWTGFAFGLGVERFAMLRYGIPDIRLLYENDQRFLSQF
ncbi:MAG: phenylalanine--tRNA ligase subunit alpha [Acidobacteria bacterium]|nr:MAG: phenylalanine--tRNA ligase subunit alpha [Acidobacteriota bacterium]